jgi:uncharacterized protein YbbC (DUF1343 family)
LNRVKRCLAAAALAGTLLAAHPSAQPTSKFASIAPVVEGAIDRHELPGAVILVGRRDEIVYRQTFGHRAVKPSPEPMTDDTVFDLASLTKVVATTTSVMQLVEQGRIRLSDRVAHFIPDFARYGKDSITIRQLLTHTSGLRPDLELETEFDGADEAIRRAVDEVPVAAPDERFVYSDINFFLLGHIVGLVSGERLDQYARAHIFGPLSMRDTMFLPPEPLRGRIAPTERCRARAWPCAGPDAADVPFLRGIVHDPTARRMAGVAGHAGLFSTAADLARFCRMLLNGGALDGQRILSQAAVGRMTSPSTPAGMRDVRGLGWDLDSTYSANRGDLFPAGSYGHTGFTGTSLWIDPQSKSYVIFLSNRVHPDGKGDVTALRGRVATIAASALSSDAVPEAEHTPALTGIDVLESEAFARLRGKRIGLVTNQTGQSRSGVSTIDLLARAPGVRLSALLSPEHGIRGQLDERVPSSRDEKTGLPIYSLYGETRRPTAAMLDGIDALVVDLQDIGARFYTYAATLAYAMEEAAARRLPVVVLDRPNPINGSGVEGPYQDAAAVGFNGYLPMPIRHGLTMGELARLFNGEKALGADLTVVAMKNWRRDDWFDATGLPWANPSPNMRNLTAAALYPGIGAIEGTNISVGRGTSAPFEQIGAPWMDGTAVASALNARELPGVRFYPVTFTPAAGAKLADQVCRGVFLVVTDRARLQPVRVGVEIAATLSALYGPRFTLEEAATLLGSMATIEKIRAGDDPAAIAASWRTDEARWRQVRAKYLLY